MGWDKFGNFYVSSELKALEGTCNKIEEFLPGHYLYSKEGAHTTALVHPRLEWSTRT
jgi:asparagine synthetase B (glutamine-hydrolysing)